MPVSHDRKWSQTVAKLAANTKIAPKLCDQTHTMLFITGKSESPFFYVKSINGRPTLLCEHNIKFSVISIQLVFAYSTNSFSLARLEELSCRRGLDENLMRFDPRYLNSREF